MDPRTPRVPQLVDGTLFLTDGGIETTLIYRDGLDLPLFAAFHLLRDDAGRAALRRYYTPYLELARERGTGFVLESATWRASHDWGERLGYTPTELDAANVAAIDLLHELRDAYRTRVSPLAISGCIGPRGDGYVADTVMTADQATAYHARQAEIFAAQGVDLVTAITMTNVPEAIGVVRAAHAVDVPAVISFTTETDGRLPAGETLGEAIARVDAETSEGPLYYMVNCAHPRHFDQALDAGAGWTGRIRGLRANASTASHAELDNATELDPGDADDLAARYADLRRRFPHLNVLGGCCGTDHTHLARIAHAVGAGR